MSVTVVSGMQWGDEGKGKLVDILAERSDYVVRYHGGNNAGHTIVVEGKKYVFNLLPSGVLHRNVYCVLANGVIIDPQCFLAEIETLKKTGFTEFQLAISERAHLLMPYHLVLDSLKESHLGLEKIGTTLRGIGPASVDKYERSGIRVGDLKNLENLKLLIFRNIENKNRIIKCLYNAQPFVAQKVYEEYCNYAKLLQPYIKDTTTLLHQALKKQKRILCESCQALMLDIDHGTYPFVTSSSPTPAAACVGTGIGMSHIDRRIGVFKVYTTRVGGGPFPTELNDSVGEELRISGHEFGSVTQRPRRTGWLDLVVLKYAMAICDFTELAVMKLDVLSGLKVLKVAMSYQLGEQFFDTMISDLDLYSQVTPIYQELKGWDDDITQVHNFDDLPQKAKEYLGFLERVIGVPITIISVGPSRDQTIFKGV